MPFAARQHVESTACSVALPAWLRERPYRSISSRGSYGSSGPALAPWAFR